MLRYCGKADGLSIELRASDWPRPAVARGYHYTTLKGAQDPAMNMGTRKTKNGASQRQSCPSVCLHRRYIVHTAMPSSSMSQNNNTDMLQTVAVDSPSSEMKVSESLSAFEEVGTVKVCLSACGCPSGYTNRHSSDGTILEACCLGSPLSTG